MPLQPPQALLAQAVVAGQHEGVQAQAAADGTRQVADQTAVGRRRLCLLQLRVAAPDAQRCLGAARRRKRADSGGGLRFSLSEGTGASLSCSAV